MFIVFIACSMDIRLFCLPKFEHCNNCEHIVQSRQVPQVLLKPRQNVKHGVSWHASACHGNEIGKTL